MRAMVFGAGLGTRLRPLTELLPKPAVPFFGRPLACWAMGLLAEAGARAVVVNTHHLADRAEEAFLGGLPEGLHLDVSREDVLLGTGGGLRRAWEMEEARRGRMESDEVLVAMNGDILFTPDLRALVREHAARGADATLVLRETADPFALGAIEIAPDGRVVSMLAKGPTRLDGSALMFTGLHILSPAALARLPVEGCVIRGGYRQWLADGLRLYGACVTDAWLDLGTPRVYRDAHLAVLAGQIELPGVSPGEAWIGADATIASGASVRQSVVGAGARIGAVRVTRSVVWPGARVANDLTDAIALPDGRIVGL